MPALRLLPSPDRRNARTGAAILAVLAAATSGAAGAQQATSAPAEQAMQSRESLELSAALSRLSRDPRNVDALVDAGNAASALGDFDAAVGFFKRGQALSPQNASLLAGLAGAMVRQGDPAAAIPLFAKAQAAGAPPQLLAADRGLAHDLVGDWANAQRYYAQALTAGGNSDEVTRRLAISQAIGGDAEAMEKTLLPLLRKQDKPAWRARAFGLAILGQTKDAVKIVKTLLPGRLADGITPYLQYMPRLTPAQQAAAANLGVFPRASEIGRDETRVAAASPATPAREAGEALVPAGRPLGSGSVAAPAAATPAQSRQAQREAEANARREARLAADRARREARIAQAAKKEARVAPPEPRPARDDGAGTETQFALTREAAVPKVSEILGGKQASPAPARAEARPAAPAPRPAPAATAASNLASVPTTAMTAAPAAQPATATALSAAPTASSGAAPVAAPGFDLARLPASGAAAEASDAAQAPATPAAAPAPAPSFGALFADLGTPTTAIAPAAGAVDIRKIEPARPKPKPKPEPVAAKPPPPSHPSRIWVQLGIGQKVSALTYDWRRMEKADPDVFKGRKPYSARLNQTNRLLTGPFASKGEANKFVDALEKAGLSGPYIWISPAGEVVDDLPR